MMKVKYRLKDRQDTRKRQSGKRSKFETDKRHLGQRLMEGRLGLELSKHFKGTGNWKCRKTRVGFRETRNLT